MARNLVRKDHARLWAAELLWWAAETPRFELEALLDCLPPGELRQFVLAMTMPVDDPSLREIVQELRCIPAQHSAN